MFTPGDKLEYGHYTVLRELGAGGMGVVYHCRDEFLQREIAIKMLLPELMADDDTVEIFRQEARLAAQLEHPNVVTIHNIGLENREGKVHHYIAMEFLPGGSLKQRITDEQKTAMEQSLEWMKQLAVGLNYAHKRGVVHQDIKPDNIFITHDGNLKIGDFGLALIATGVAIERAVQGKGTPAYMSPELCRGDPQDHRSDIYSLGAVFYELLTKERPYKASGMIEMAMKHATAPIPSSKKLNTSVPDVLDKAIQKMMAKNPEDRYQTLAEVLTILEKLLLELQVARLGVGMGNISVAAEPASTPAAAPVKEKEPPPPPIPNVANYADDFANFLADQGDSKDKAPQLHSKAAKPAAPEIDPLDDLLDSLLSEQPAQKPIAKPAEPAKTADNVAESAAKSESGKANFTKADSAKAAAEPVAADAPKAAEPVKAESKTAGIMSEASRAMQEAAAAAAAAALTGGTHTKPPSFDDDITGDIDAVFQSVVRAEAAAMAQATHAAAEAAQIGTTISGPAAERAGSTTSGGSPRVSRTGIPAVGAQQKQLELSWSFKTYGPIGWTSMPVMTKDRKGIMVGSVDGRLYCIDAAKGTLLWQYDTGAAIIASPVVFGERVLIASTNGSLHALTSAGSKIWEYTSSSPLVATPCIHNDDILLSSMDGTVKYLNANDGSVKWTYRTDGPVVSTPQVLENLVFFGSKDKCLHAISLDKGWRQWISPTQGAIVSSPLVSTDSVYIGSTDGNMYALEAETGKLVWKYPTEHAIVAKGTLEFTSVTVCSEDKWLHCVEKYKGALVWKARLHSPVMTNLTSTSGHIYAANREGWMQCFNLKNGELQWQMNCEKRLESSPLIAGKMMYIGMVSGDLHAYNLPA